ncbi:MAG: MarR family transcriptional regulator [Pseudonocardia sp.]|uniref:MarR family winged helix-turn-helix transcriptional regulator n=1 Tax=unclassified Pseudonocardia TaxID=2619320 RepID=UPI00086D2C8F|nr:MULTISPECIES: MarR family transcriptional regulator [unclassified Pseudonocardia]MBN9108317.1 MarR family transcriptional regulator [Pseudonocardia sp.]ODU30303.1 MAG: hypothetical protein ABS80_00035 [Pseudonocardia sp. SCN 72-51]ODV08699.1 MAG: hypothetical protein ABT15_02480 [Pseudonocardia sp. SCN 73-27]
MSDTTSALAVSLARAIQRLRARIRAEAGGRSSPWSRTQLLALDRVITGPPMTTSDLAVAEYVRPQSMAATLAPLEEGGLITRRRDPQDGRRVLLLPTDRGRELLRSVQEQQDSWLAAAIGAELDDEDLASLTDLVRLLDRLTDSSVRAPVPQRLGR